MATTQGAIVLRQIRKLAAVQYSSQQSDVQLLQQFIAERDETAFTALVQRHGSMVFGVCRSVLHHQQDAEDAFQAAFMVLASKAKAIRKHEAVSSWLHGVAYRLALKARARANRRQMREQPAHEHGSPSTVDDLTLRELRAILNEELHRLPEKYRTPLLLCYWEGKTRDEAAEHIGVTAEAFKKYLERARNLLKSRLVGRGLVPSAAFFAALFAENGAWAAVSSELTQSTVHAAVAFAAGKGASAGVSAAAAVLAEGAIRAMTITKCVTTILATLLLGSVGTGLGLGAYQALQGEPSNAPGQAVAAANVPSLNGKAKVAAGKKADKDRIVGVWRFTKGRADGKDLPEEFVVLARLTFTKDGKAIMSVVEEGKEGKYKLVGPGIIDITLGVGSDQLAPAIYKFDGDNHLTICVSNDAADSKRPTEFAADKDTGHVLFILNRAKPGEEKPTPQEIAKYQPGADKIREAAARAQSANNLKQIGLAMHAYLDGHNTFPAHAIYSKDGKTPLLSWRVAILPYIEQEGVYREFKLDEPWDSPHNKKLISKMPGTYKPGGVGTKEVGKTYYQVVTGPDTVFDGAKKMKLLDIKDGTSNTLLVIEAKDPVVWSKPDDLRMPKDKDKIPAVGGLFKNGLHILLCDGSVRFLPRDPAPALLRAIITPNGGENIDNEKLDQGK
jgi:RNA polymerase sigma factor (sigma-70 family)